MLAHLTRPGWPGLHGTTIRRDVVYPLFFFYKKIFTMTGHAMATETQSEAEAGMMARTSTTTRAMGGLRLRF
jgi:hypothetical protein